MSVLAVICHIIFSYCKKSNCATHQPQTSWVIRMVFVCINGIIRYILSMYQELPNQPIVAVLDAHSYVNALRLHQNRDKK